MKSLRVVFIGIPSLLARESLRAINRHSRLVGIAESKASSWNASKEELLRYRSPFTFVARRCGIPYLLLGKSVIGDHRLAEWLRELQPDVICVAGLHRLLTPAEFAIPTLGAVNLHPSLLPKFRGPHPFYWQYHEFDLAGGVTVHRISAAMDEGDILAQRSFAIPLGALLDDTLARAAAAGASATEDAIQKIEAGGFNARPQQHLVCPVVARRVANGEVPTGWHDWPLDRAWHFLRGTHATHPFLELPFGPANQWTIGEREISDPGGRGLVEKDACGFYVAHPGGKIRLLPPAAWTVKRKIAKRLRRYVEGYKWRV